MHNPKKFPQDTTSALDDIGGELLTGSGFETEVPEAEFGTGELSHNGQPAVTEE